MDFKAYLSAGDTIQIGLLYLFPLKFILLCIVLFKKSYGLNICFLYMSIIKYVDYSYILFSNLSNKKIKTLIGAMLFPSQLVELNAECNQGYVTVKQVRKIDFIE